MRQSCISGSNGSLLLCIIVEVVSLYQNRRVFNRAKDFSLFAVTINTIILYQAPCCQSWFLSIICFVLPLILVPVLVRTTSLTPLRLNWAESFLFWQRNAHVTDRVKQKRPLWSLQLGLCGLDSTWDTWTVCLLLKMNWFIWQEMNLSKILCNCLVADLDDKYVHEVARPDTEDIIAGGAGGG